MGKQGNKKGPNKKGPSKKGASKKGGGGSSSSSSSSSTAKVSARSSIEDDDVFGESSSSSSIAKKSVKKPNGKQKSSSTSSAAPPLQAELPDIDLDAELQAALADNDRDADTVVQGDEIEHLFRAPQADDRVKTIWGTWSRVKTLYPGIMDAPKTRKGAMHTILTIMAGALKSENLKSNAAHQVSLSDINVGIWMERHADGSPHFHIIIHVEKKVRLAQRLKPAALELPETPEIFWRVPRSGALAGINTCDRVLSYVMVYKGGKAIDLEPRFFNGFASVISAKLWREHRESLAKFRGKAAQVVELYGYLSAHPEVETLPEFERHLNKALKRDQTEMEKLPLMRLKLWISKTGRNAKLEFDAQRKRVFIEQNYDLVRKPVSFFFEEALQTPCECENKDTYLFQLQDIVQHHDGNCKGDAPFSQGSAASGSVRAKLGEYAKAWVAGIFERQRHLCVLGGRGSGKSSVTRPFFLIFGPNSLREAISFIPNFSSANFSWTGWSEDCTRLIDLNDFRTSAAGIDPSTLLNVTEGSKTVKLEQKGGGFERGNPLPKTAVVTANYLEETLIWKRKDIAALEGRMFEFADGTAVIYMQAEVPQEIRRKYRANCLECECRGCAARFLQWAMDGAEHCPEAM